LREALSVVRGIDASVIARDTIARAAGRDRTDDTGQAIGAALRAARLGALRRWRAERRRGQMR